MNEVIIELGTGKLENGFDSATIELKQNGKTKWKMPAKLEKAPELCSLLNKWESFYPKILKLSNHQPNRSITINKTVKGSTQDAKEINRNFEHALNNWLNLGQFSKAEKELRTYLKSEDRIVVTIVSKEHDIWWLPWHKWIFFESYPNAVEVFCKQLFPKVDDIHPSPNGKVNILGLFGEDPALDLNPQFLETLPDAHVEIATTPSMVEIADRLTKTRKWDMFVFNGHGDTVPDDAIGSPEGIIYLNNQTSLEISRLKVVLKKAVKRGLKIAIFNCCSGLGLAEQLSDVNIPYIIVMRGKIPDRVAKSFLVNLLDYYSQGDSFPEAFKEARHRLGLDRDGFAIVAHWLPMLFHNPLTDDVTWQDLSITVTQLTPPSRISITANFLKKHWIWTTGGISLLVSSLAILSPLPFNPISSLDDKVANFTQATTEALISPERSLVTIVNYDKSVFLGNTLNDDSELIEILEKVEQTTKPLWGIDLEVSPQPKVFDRPNVVKGCTDDCDRQPSIRELLKQANLLSSSQSNLNWNSNSLTKNSLERILTKIDIVKFSEISNKSPTEIKQLFDDKIVLVGFVPGKDRTITLTERKITPVERKAIELDRIIRANHSQNPLPLPIDWSNMQKLVWVFTGSLLGGLALCPRKWKLLLPAAIGVQIVIAVGFIIWGHGVPIMVTSIAILMVGGVIYMIQHHSLDRPA